MELVEILIVCKRNLLFYYGDEALLLRPVLRLL